MRWIIWYDDGSKIEGKGVADWETAPRQGILIVREYDREPNALVHMGCDYYWFEDDQIKSCNARDIDRYLIRIKGLRCIKLGRWGSDDVWKRAHDEAM